MVERPGHFIDWTPDGLEIVFDDGTAVMMIDVDGSRLRAIVDANPGNGFPYHFHADVSPDGSSIVYSSCQYPTDGLYVRYRHANLGRRRYPLEGRERYIYEIASVAIDGSGRRRLTENGNIDHYPSWSPDGSKVAFTRDVLHGPFEFGPLRMMEKDGSNEQALVDEQTSFSVPSTNRYRVTASAPQWSPDGEQLAVAAAEYDQGSRVHPGAVYVIRADGSGFKKVSDAVSAPSWSPDGSRLALAKYHGRYVVLVTVAPDGSDPQTVATITERGIFEDLVGRLYLSWIDTLAWSPDGTHILFTCDVGLCVVDLQGDLVGHSLIEPPPRDPPKLSTYGGRPQAAWSPDGSRIAVRLPDDPRSEPGGNPVVYTMDPDGTNVLVLVRSGQAKRSQDVPFYVSSCRDGSAVPEPESNPGLVGDCEALKTVRDVMAHNITLNWGSGVPIDSWEGITIGGSPRRVTGLELLWGVGIGKRPWPDGQPQPTRSNLRPELAGLTKLQALSLAVNEVVGTVPAELATLTDLRRLYIKWHYLQGCLSREFSDLWVDATNLERCEGQGP